MAEWARDDSDHEGEENDPFPHESLTWHLASSRGEHISSHLIGYVFLRPFERLSTEKKIFLPPVLFFFSLLIFFLLKLKKKKKKKKKKNLDSLQTKKGWKTYKTFWVIAEMPI